MTKHVTTPGSIVEKFAAYSAAAPAVFVFDPETGEATSMNSGAVELISRFDLNKAPRLSLATIERGVMAGGKVKSDPVVTDGLVDSASELRRVCRGQDGSVLALSRIWAPGSSTMLVVEDMTAAEQDRRRRRIWDMMVSHMASSGNVATVLEKALRIFCLLSGSPSGEVWMPEGSALVRSAIRVSKNAVKSGTGVARLKTADDSVVGRAWSGREPIYADNRVAIPIHAGETLVAVLVLDASPTCTSDYLAFSLIEGLAPLFGLALFVFRQSEELQALRIQASAVNDGVKVPRKASQAKLSRPKAMSVVEGMRAAG